MIVGLVMGLLGYALDKFKYPKTPLVITLILGRTMELNLRRGLMLSQGSLAPLFTRPFSIMFLVFTALALTIPFIQKKRQAKKAQLSQTNKQ
jgi:putative tricarboxylic transport membrane protein